MLFDSRGQGARLIGDQGGHAVGAALGDTQMFCLADPLADLIFIDTGGCGQSNGLLFPDNAGYGFIQPGSRNFIGMHGIVSQLEVGSV